MKASKDIWIASVKTRVLENSELNNDGSIVSVDEAAQKAQAESRLTFGPFASSNFYED